MNSRAEKLLLCCTRYESERYQPWQKQRVNASPGLTGYWQVNGKNKTTFNEMVNMDIYYTKNPSLWLALQEVYSPLQISIESISNVRYTATRNVQGPLHIAYSSTA